MKHLNTNTRVGEGGGGTHKDAGPDYDFNPSRAAQPEKYIYFWIYELF